MAYILETGKRHGSKLYVRTDAAEDFRMTDERDRAKQYPTAGDALRASTGFSVLYDLQVTEAHPEICAGYRPALNPYSAAAIWRRR